MEKVPFRNLKRTTRVEKEESSPSNDITFNVNGENIKTIRYMLSSSSEGNS
ncbi:39_t:CDS:2 [Funneliformis geosporum]|nr:39_t:CDS:2 [Funneliformis geosporum]